MAILRPVVGVRVHLPESEYRTLSSSEWQVAILRPVVGVTTDLLLNGIADFVDRSLLRSQPIGRDELGGSMALQRLLHEAERSLSRTSG